MLLQKYRPASASGMVANGLQAAELERAVVGWKRGTVVVLSGPSGCGKNLAIELAASKHGLSITGGGAEDLLKACTQASMWSKGRIIVGDLDSELSPGDAQKLSESSMWPVVLVTDDIYKRELSDFRRNDFVKLITFYKAWPSELAAFLRRVCASERIPCDDKVLFELATRSDGDVRFALNALESLDRVDAVSIQSLERDRSERLFERLDAIFHGTPLDEADFQDLNAWVLENLSGHYAGEELDRAYRCFASSDALRRNGLDVYSAMLMRMLPRPRGQLKYAMPRWVLNGNRDKLTEVAALAHCSSKKAKAYSKLAHK